jgi:hypothetical protein
MGVSCVCRLIASAVVALSAAGCAGIPHVIEAFAVESFGYLHPRTLDSNGGGSNLGRKCHEALVKAALPYGLIEAATAAERVDRTRGKIRVTMAYLRQGGPEIRTALIGCDLDRRGRVMALKEHR